MAALLRTVGHGSLSAEAFADLLAAAGVRLVVDVRRHPGSRRHPQFHKAAMQEVLAGAGIAYRWEEDLGGRRPIPEGTPDVALSEALRGYAAHMRGEAFGAALDRVVDDAEAGTVAVCCAEGDWRRCHRMLLADAALLLRDVPVEHLTHDGGREAHEPTPAVRRTDAGLVYDRGSERPLPLDGGPGRP